jgi:hypothetical protein
MSDTLQTLARINLDDLIDAFGSRELPLAAAVLRRLCRRPARELAERVTRFDRNVASYGLAAAARELQRDFVRSVHVFGRERLPRGPLIVLANHPGLTDTLALFNALDRSDLRVLARPRPFLRALPNMERRLLYVGSDRLQGIALVRALRTHLRAGGAVLTFPAGCIEPDPDVYDGALGSLALWSDGGGRFMRLSPGTALLPAVVRSVVWSKTAHHPLTRLRSSREDRELLGAALQLLVQLSLRVRPVAAEVEFGTPITARSLGSSDNRAVHDAVIAQMQRLLQQPQRSGGVAVL